MFSGYIETNNMGFPIPRGLNPQASEYIPRFHQNPLPLLSPSPSPSPYTFISLPPPPPWSHLPYPNTNTLLPPPLLSHPPPPPPSQIISIPRPSNIPPPPLANQDTELLPVCVNRPNNVRVSRGTRVSTSNRRRYKRRDLGGREGQYSNLNEEKKRRSGNWSNLKKHGMRHLREDEYKTTVMIKNIPYEFTRQMLIDFMDKHCMLENEKSDEQDRGSRNILSAYDFLYLPMDFKTKKNKGYAFVNFTHPWSVWKFFNTFNNTKWDSTNSPKIKRIICARIQGKEALVYHFQKTYFDCECEEFFPICFSPARDGSGKRVKATTVGRRTYIGRV